MKLNDIEKSFSENVKAGNLLGMNWLYHSLPKISRQNNTVLPKIDLGKHPEGDEFNFLTTAIRSLENDKSVDVIEWLLDRAGDIDFRYAEMKKLDCHGNVRIVSVLPNAWPLAYAFICKNKVSFAYLLYRQNKPLSATSEIFRVQRVRGGYIEGFFKNDTFGEKKFMSIEDFMHFEDCQKCASLIDQSKHAKSNSATKTLLIKAFNEYPQHFLLQFEFYLRDHSRHGLLSHLFDNDHFFKHLVDVTLEITKLKGDTDQYQLINLKVAEALFAGKVFLVGEGKTFSEDEQFYAALRPYLKAAGKAKALGPILKSFQSFCRHGDTRIFASPLKLDKIAHKKALVKRSDSLNDLRKLSDATKKEDLPLFKEKLKLVDADVKEIEALSNEGSSSKQMS